MYHPFLTLPLHHFCVTLALLYLHATFRETISSIEIARSKFLPKTFSPKQHTKQNTKQHTCYFHHALAADEQCVNFLPEYASGETFKISPKEPQTEANALFKHGNEQLLPHIKEVWFCGTHFDIVYKLGKISNYLFFGLVLILLVQRWREHGEF
jgi:hypothetical protein